MDFFNKYENVTEDDYIAIADPSWPTYQEFITHYDIPVRVYNDIDAMLDLVPFEHPSFCVLPFIGYEYPRINFCCLTPNGGADREQVKQDMLQGIRPHSCSKCWNLEDAGIKSDRLIKNGSYDYYHGNLKDFYNQVVVNSDVPFAYYKIDSTNTCNAQCATCTPEDSSSWISLYKQHGVRYEHKRIDINNLQVNYAEAKSILFRGGEPFLAAKNFEILSKLIEHDNTDCFISFITNGSIWPSDEQLEILQQFPNLVISLSIDGVGPVFEYLRYPLKWDTILENFARWKTFPNIKFGVNYTLSNMNILYHNDTVNWFRENNLPFLINPVYGPTHFNINSLPNNIKKKLIEDIRNIDLDLFKAHSNSDDENFEKFLQEIKKQDEWKGISIKDYLPEFVNLLGNPF